MMNPTSKPKQLENPIVSVIIVVVTMIVVMTVYELVKQYYFATISSWTSGLMTIIISTMFAAGLAGAILFRYHESLSPRLAQVKQTEFELQTLYRAIEQSPTSVVITDLNGLIEYVNPSFTLITGYTIAEAIGKNPNILNSSYHSVEFYEEMWSTLMAGQEWRGEQCNRKKNGELYWEFASLSAVKNEDGKIIHYLAVKEDITEQKRAREAIQAQKEHLNIVLESLTHPFYVINVHDYSVATANSAARRLGVSEEITCYAATHYRDTPCDSTEHPCPLKIVMQTRKPTVVEHIHFDEAGSPINIEIHGFPIFNEADEVVQMIEYSRDITKRKSMEREIEQHRNHLKQLVADRTHRLQAITTLSEQLNKILDINLLLHELVNQFEAYFGCYYAHIYLLDESSNELMMVEGYGEVGRILKTQNHRLGFGQGIVGRVAQNNKPFFTNNVSETPQFFRNTLLPDTQSELAVPLRLEEKLIGVLDIQSNKIDVFAPEDISMLQSIADQTAIAIANAQLLAERQTTIVKLKEVDRAKSQFITMMSHELRTPLQAINGFSELLLSGLSGELSTQAQSDVQLIYDNGQHLMNLINDIIDISQIESGQIQIDPTEVDAIEMITEVITATRPLSSGKPIELLTDLSDTLPPLQADHIRLKQILLNLVSNAIKFTDKGEIIIKAVVEDNYVRFSIIDSGVGIPPDKLALIFNKFQQADMSDSRQYGGTGLGLPICKELVEMHGGTIGVQSNLEAGSEFWFTMPMIDS
ncbi:ATP-binding protein [Anaerolineales bacterium HSG24]|nr:ATP-binding protein [Anaerolineales bacterium HSG24]